MGQAKESGIAVFPAQAGFPPGGGDFLHTEDRTVHQIVAQGQFLQLLVVGVDPAVQQRELLGQDAVLPLQQQGLGRVQAEGAGENEEIQQEKGQAAQQDAARLVESGADRPPVDLVRLGLLVENIFLARHFKHKSEDISLQNYGKIPGKKLFLCQITINTRL